MSSTERQRYRALIADLEDGTHTFDGRPVLVWDAYPGEGRYAGAWMVTVQYGSNGVAITGLGSMTGALLRDYSFPLDVREE